MKRHCFETLLQSSKEFQLLKRSIFRFIKIFVKFSDFRHFFALFTAYERLAKGPKYNGFIDAQRRKMKISQNLVSKRSSTLPELPSSKRNKLENEV